MFCSAGGSNQTLQSFRIGNEVGEPGEAILPGNASSPPGDGPPAGHRVHGIAAAVDQAPSQVDRQRPMSALHEDRQRSIATRISPGLHVKRGAPERTEGQQQPAADRQLGMRNSDLTTWLSKASSGFYDPIHRMPDSWNVYAGPEYYLSPNARCFITRVYK